MSFSSTVKFMRLVSANFWLALGPKYVIMGGWLLRLFKLVLIVSEG